MLRRKSLPVHLRAQTLAPVALTNATILTAAEPAIAGGTLLIENKKTRADPVQRNDVWAMDSVHDQLHSGLKIHILSIIDAYTRFVLAWLSNVHQDGSWTGVCLKRSRPMALYEEGGIGLLPASKIRKQCVH